MGLRIPRAVRRVGALNLLQFEGLNHKCEIRSGVRAEECRDLLRDFFKKKRVAEDVDGK